jgi:hypothetical protein
MKRLFASGLLCVAALMPVCAAASPFYVALQADTNSGGFSLGYMVDKTYAVEAHYRESKELISHSGVTSDTKITGTGLSVLAMFPMKMSGGSSYRLFAKVGYERQTKDEIYSFPVSVTYNGSVTNIENRTILGGGVQYEFSQNFSARTGIEVIGDKRSIYWAGIFTF